MSEIQLRSSRVTAVGNALIDLLIHEDDAFLGKIGKEKGGMTLVEDLEIREVLEKTDQRPVTVPGGAACNTICGIARLGGESVFIAKRGNDPYGNAYEEYLREMGVMPYFYTSEDLPTGKVVSIITPDAQRSMLTCLGASVTLDPFKIVPELFRNSGIAMIEGYLLFNRQLMRASLDAAKASGALVALDLASYEVVRESEDILSDIVRNDVDILIANEDEARAFTGFSDEMEALEAMSANVKIAVLKVGARGSHIAYKGDVIPIAADGRSRSAFARKIEDDDASGATVEIKDTTGAGDLWAAGFLYGIANGFSLEKSGRIGAACGFEVCQVIGAHIPEEGWQRIEKIVSENPDESPLRSNEISSDNSLKKEDLSVVYE